MTYLVFVRLIEKHKRIDYVINGDSASLKYDRLCVPGKLDLKMNILEEAHCSTYYMHPRNTKMYKILNEQHWWLAMKREIAEFF